MTDGHGLGGLLGLAVGVAIVSDVLHHAHGESHRVRQKMKKKRTKAERDFDKMVWGD
jgi:hypothetical protein